MICRPTVCIRLGHRPSSSPTHPPLFITPPWPRLTPHLPLGFKHCAAAAASSPPARVSPTPPLRTASTPPSPTAVLPLVVTN
uniref:Uncharacterized protein n=1 Tax=Setaria viridis TaxID=4556 RepID=A0A4U6W8W7_SETVI|nr:hypothetical protein SEVIR_1G094350v2 [Setaria viridis]